MHPFFDHLWNVLNHPLTAVLLAPLVDDAWRAARPVAGRAGRWVADAIRLLRRGRD